MKKELFKTIIRASAILLLVTGAGNGYAQKYKPKTPCFIGGGLEVVSSGNWHGAFFSPYFNLTKGRNSLNGGPLFQKRTMQLSGGKISFSHNLSTPRKKHYEYEEEETEIPVEDYVKSHGNQLIQLNVFGFAQYIHHTSLSYSAEKTEQKASVHSFENKNFDWSQVRLSTAEAGVGFELYVKLSKRVSWKNYVAGAVYYHINYVNGMYHEQVAPSLVLGTGIHICPL